MYFSLPLYQLHFTLYGYFDEIGKFDYSEKVWLFKFLLPVSTSLVIQIQKQIYTI